MRQDKRSLISKRRMMPILMALLVAAATCDGLDNITVTAEGQAVIPQRTVIDELIGTLAFTGFEGLDLTQSQEFRNQGYSKDQVDSVHISSFTMAIQSPQGANFDFLSSIRFYASADGLPEVLIAELDPVPRGVSTLELVVDSTLELRPYVIAPSVTITTSATGTRPPDETTVNADADFEIEVNVSGACQ